MGKFVRRLCGKPGGHNNMVRDLTTAANPQLIAAPILRLRNVATAPAHSSRQFLEHRSQRELRQGGPFRGPQTSLRLLQLRPKSFGSRVIPRPRVRELRAESGRFRVGSGVPLGCSLLGSGVGPNMLSETEHTPLRAEAAAYRRRPAMILLQP